MIVVGDPRVPADAVRTELAARGHLAAAVEPEPEWIPQPWAGLSETGERGVVNVRGYADPLWERVRRGMVRAELRQAIGRGRASLANGIPVEVLAVEETGELLADVSLPGMGLADGPRRLLDVMGRMSSGAGEKSVKSPAMYHAGKITDFPVADLAASLGGECVRNVRNWLAVLERRGQVVRRGGGVGRGGVRWGLVLPPAELGGAGGGASCVSEPVPELQVGELSAAVIPGGVVVESVPEPVPGVVSVAGPESAGVPDLADKVAGVPPSPEPVDASASPPPPPPRPWTCRGEPWDRQPRNWSVNWVESPRADSLSSPPPTPPPPPGGPAGQCWWSEPFPEPDRWWEFLDVGDQ